MAYEYGKSNWRFDWTFFAICALAASVFLVGVDRAPVPTVDGAVRASEARTIVETGTWFPIYYQGAEVHDHPPLFVWITALSFKIFGINDFAANFPSRIFAALTLLFTGLIAIEIGFSRGVALLSVLVLAATRDFVLSNVRGYIEPLLSFFIYGGLWLVFRQRRRRSYWAAVGAGICVFGAFFSKGPPALWPFLAFTILLIWLGGLPGARLRLFGTYIITTGVCFLLLYWWIVKNGYQPTWQAYFRDQVLSSALEGRGGAQTGEPLYFVKILAQYYWPWMPFLLLGIWRSLKWLFTFEITDEAIYSWIFGVFALGFIVGFSAVKWKFWYYIAPAYPALALFIASTMYSGVRKWAQAPLFRNIIIAASITWFVVGSILPIPLHRERVPEVQAFKETIRRSNVEGNVLFFGAPGDHNMVATSGDWYFGKRVEKIDSISELARKLDSRKSAWLIVDNQFLERCGEEWCRRTIPIQAAHGTTLALYR